VRLPVYDHIVIVIEENKDYEQIFEQFRDAAPYINQLRYEGANLTQMFAEEHHSEGNYFWLFSGSNQHVGFRDRIPRKQFSASNLGTQLLSAPPLSFKGYSEDLPAVGSPTKKHGLYKRKHVPWISFSNIPTSSNLRFEDFPADFNDLPTVSFVIPNMVNDMHGVAHETIPEEIRAGDNWLQEHIKPYYQWAKNHNSLLIITFDENDQHVLFGGPTNPRADDKPSRNRIVTIFAGAHIKPGDYAEGKGVTHVNVLRTLEAMYKLPKSGKQQKFAENAGITDEFLIQDIFQP
jgi:acid phosphatase